MPYIIFLFLLSFSLFAQEKDSLNIPDTISYTILAPIEVNIKEHIDYPIFFVSEIDKPEIKPPEEGLIVLSENETGKTKMIIFENNEIKPPYLIEKRNKKGKVIYKYIYLWHQIDLKPFCEKDGTYQIYIISNKVRSNIIDFEIYNAGEESFFNFYATCFGNYESRKDK